MALLRRGTLASLLLGSAGQFGQTLAGHLEQGLIVGWRGHKQSLESTTRVNTDDRDGKGASGAFAVQ